MSVFVIPMAGLSSRFFNEGFHVPKYQLIIDNVSMFSWSVLSFKKYFKEDYFLFICRDVFDTPNFIKSEIKKLGISNYNIIILGDKTKGQGDTVNRGLLQSEILSSILDENLFIFNIDSKLLDFSKPSFLSECSGYLEVFKEKGEHWSFVVPNGPKKVYRTTEKERVSDFCSDGLYYFHSVKLFLQYFQKISSCNQYVNGEIYIAPMYNYLIFDGLEVYYELIPRDSVIICGTPKEYSDFISDKKNEKNNSRSR